MSEGRPDQKGEDDEERTLKHLAGRMFGVMEMRCDVGGNIMRWWNKAKR